MKTQRRLSAKERMDAEARIAALRAEANAISRTLKKDDETTVEVVPVEAPAEEVTEATEEVVEEAPVEEVTEATEEVVEEAPIEEVTEATEEVVEEAPVELPIIEEVSGQNNPDENGNNKATGFVKWIVGMVGTFVLGILVMLILGTNQQLPSNGSGDTDGAIINRNDGIVDTNNGTVDTNDGVVGTTPGGDTDVAFDMDAFVVSTVNIANTLTTDEDVATNVDVFAKKIGADKLEELVGKYGDLTVQKAIAEYIAFVPEIKMNQYINNNGLAYNPNAADDYYHMLDDADKVYADATGKNPNGALMSLEGYDIYKSNREAMKALIVESGDVALLTWYEAKTTGYDAMVQQNNDTATALAYKEEVKLELVNNTNGSIKLLEVQLEQKINGTNADTLNYTDVYAEFIKNNYMYVVAN